MKVLIITGSVVSSSGWGRHSSAIIDELQKQDVQVAVCAEEVESSGTFSHVLLSTQHPFPIFSFLKNVQTVRRAARGVDCVHALDGRFGVYGYLATLGSRTPLYLNGIGTYSVAPLYSFWKGWLFRLVYLHAKKIFCISEYTRAQLQKAGIPASKLVTVHYGAPSLQVPSLEEMETYAKKYDIREESFPLILTVGAIKDRKGQLETLKAVSLLRTTYPQILYVLAGKGNSPRYLEAIRTYVQENSLEEHVRIIEDADDRALAFLYTRCTVFALNSNTDEVAHHFEGFGAVVVEAAEFGKPSVGSSNSGIEDAIVDGETGWLTHQRDPAHIADRIHAILTQYEYFSRNASIRYKDFNWQKTAAAYIYAYRNN